MIRCSFADKVPFSRAIFQTRPIPCRARRFPSTCFFHRYQLLHLYIVQSSFCLAFPFHPEPPRCVPRKTLYMTHRAPWTQNRFSGCENHRFFKGFEKISSKKSRKNSDLLLRFWKKSFIIGALSVYGMKLQVAARPWRVIAADQPGQTGRRTHTSHRRPCGSGKNVEGIL